MVVVCESSLQGPAGACALKAARLSSAGAVGYGGVCVKPRSHFSQYGRVSGCAVSEAVTFLGSILGLQGMPASLDGPPPL